MPIIRGPKPCAYTEASLAVAKLVGVEAKYEKCDHFSIVTCNGAEYPDCPTALRYFARLRPDLCLYGQGFADSISVDYWLSRIVAEFLTPLVSFREWQKRGGDVSLIWKDIDASFKKVEDHLLTRTYLACERMTIADVLLAVTLTRFNTLKSGWSNQYPNATRWSSTVLGHEAVRSNISGGAPAEGCENKPAKTEQSAKPAAKQSSKPAANKAADIEDQIEAEAKAKAKRVNPLDQLPPSNLVLDAWKREYSNSKDLLGTSMPWFWKNFDPEGYSLWFMKYEKMPGENKVGFTTSNMLGGFLQRLDNAFRKYSFAVINVMGTEGDFDIQGVWLIRGSEIPAELKEHPSFEYHTFRKLDPSKDKGVIEAYWTADEEIEGRPIHSCKVWK